ncbi:hypothetical protein ON010_g7146 [Phytophthora cinnamomi]|nr:hypothetical protein ON010_g7146 [Phytophthora cinnamomi]
MTEQGSCATPKHRAPRTKKEKMKEGSICLNPLLPSLRKVKNPEIYDDLIGKKRKTWDVYAAWRDIDVTPEKIAKAMKNVGYGDKSLEHIVTGYRQYLENMKHVRME